MQRRTPLNAALAVLAATALAWSHLGLTPPASSPGLLGGSAGPSQTGVQGGQGRLPLDVDHDWNAADPA